MVLPFVIAPAVMAAALCALMAAAWVIQRRTGNSGWVDTIWTFSTGYVGVVAALWPFGANELPARQFMVAALVMAWTLRLGLHLAVRSVGIHDDPRYAAYAKRWGSAAPRKMFVFLQQQALGSLPLVFAIFLAAQVPVPALRVQDYLGALILVAGIAGEGIADAQLKRFRDNPANKGRVCDTGLWRWSRHPNYFFQWFGWLGFPVIAITPGYPWGSAALLAPLFMFWILNYVTGVPPLEEQMVRSRGEAWRAYQARTSRFFPLPPKA
jgi:steroid 5-alpha reductase family enzyme